MPLIVAGTNSYNTEAELATYALDRGITVSGAASALLIQAMDWLELQPFVYDKYDSTQALEFPRTGDADVPANIKKAQLVAALILDGGGSLVGSIARAVKSEKIDVLETVYMDNAGDSVRYPELALLLRNYVTGAMVVSRG